MMIPNGYEINVSQKSTDYTGRECYKHYCRIELNDSFDEFVEQKFKELRDLFPDDFKLTLTKVTCYGETIVEE